MTEGKNNCIVISFPPGGKGHIAGRLISTCNNVKWYDYTKNGDYPWLPYNDIDKMFTPFHFNRKFSGAKPKGVCSDTIPPVLDIAERLEFDYDVKDINYWKEKLYPYNFVYPLHSDLDKTKQFFGPAKYITIIPNKLDVLVDRFMKTTINYFISPRNKEFTFRDMYENLSKATGRSVRECVYNDLYTKIENYRLHTSTTDVVIESVDELMHVHNFKKITEQLDLEFNLESYNKTVQFIDSAYVE